MKYEQYKHFFIGENRLCAPGEEIILKLSEPRCYIRYSTEEGFMSGYDDFMSRVADIQWLDGKAPTEPEKEQILETAYNFLALDERLLESDEAAMIEELRAEGYTDEDIEHFLS